MVTSFFLIPAPPLFGALVMLLLGRKLNDRVISILCCATVLASFVLAVGAFLPLLHNPTDSGFDEAICSRLGSRRSEPSGDSTGTCSPA